MKLSATFKNDSNGGLSNQLKEFLTTNLDDVNKVVKNMKAPAVAIVREDGTTAFPIEDTRAHLASAGVKGELFRACLTPPEEGHLRLVYLLTGIGEGAVDVLIENPDPIE